jgi:hypothetical protein
LVRPDKSTLENVARRTIVAAFFELLINRLIPHKLLPVPVKNGNEANITLVAGYFGAPYEKIPIIEQSLTA